MTYPFEIVAHVLDQYRGLPERLHSRNGKSAEWYRSHGRRPRTEDPMANGNVSEVEHFMRYVRKYEDAAAGAGRMLSHSVYVALEAEFCGECNCDQSELECEVIDETADVQKWLARFDIDSASRRDLVQFIDECKQAEDKITAAKSAAIAQLKVAAARNGRKG